MTSLCIFNVILNFFKLLPYFFNINNFFFGRSADITRNI